MPAEVLERNLTLDNEGNGDDSQRDSEMIASDGETKFTTSVMAADYMYMYRTSYGYLECCCDTAEL